MVLVYKIARDLGLSRRQATTLCVKLAASFSGYDFSTAISGRENLIFIQFVGFAGKVENVFHHAKIDLRKELQSWLQIMCELTKEFASNYREMLKNRYTPSESAHM